MIGENDGGTVVLLFLFLFGVFFLVSGAISFVFSGVAILIIKKKFENKNGFIPAFIFTAISLAYIFALCVSVYKMRTLDFSLSF